MRFEIPMSLAERISEANKPILVKSDDAEFRAILSLEKILALATCAIGKYNAEQDGNCIEARQIIAEYRKRIGHEI